MTTPNLTKSFSTSIVYHQAWQSVTILLENEDLGTDTYLHITAEEALNLGQRLITAGMHALNNRPGPIAGRS